MPMPSYSNAWKRKSDLLYGNCVGTKCANLWPLSNINRQFARCCQVLLLKQSRKSTEFSKFSDLSQSTILNPEVGPRSESVPSVPNEATKFHELAGRIIGCAMAVHSGLGNGFREIIYRSALEMEMEEAGISFSREYEMPVFYNGRLIGLRRVDFPVEGVICVELKAVVELTDADLAQVKNDLDAFDLNVGLLINFGAKSLQFKRVYNRTFKQQTQGNPSIPPSRKSR